MIQGRRRRSGWSGLSRTNNLELNQLADQLELHYSHAIFVRSKLGNQLVSLKNINFEDLQPIIITVIMIKFSLVTLVSCPDRFFSFLCGDGEKKAGRARDYGNPPNLEILSPGDRRSESEGWRMRWREDNTVLPLYLQGKVVS